MKKRIVSRIDIKNNYIIKGIHLEGLRKIGDPNLFARKYYNDGVDEIIFIDSVASLYNRNTLSEIINQACKDIHVPITVGGGIRTLDDIEKMFKNGADKVAINTQALKTPNILSQAASYYGSQNIVVSMEVKRINTDLCEPYYDNGREPSGIDLINWIRQVTDLGVGEIFLTSIDQDGTKKGFDIELAQKVSKITTVPIVVSGGAGNLEHIHDLFENQDISGCALGSILHYNDFTIQDIKSYLSQKGHKIR